jgi:hypothetical protein
MIIICKVTSGMCNRLIPFITSFRLANILDAKFYVLWDNDCRDSAYPYVGKKTEYNDMFEYIDNIDNITYINDTEKNELLNKYSKKLIIKYMETDMNKYTKEYLLTYNIIYFEDYVHPIYIEDDNVIIKNYSYIDWIIKQNDYLDDIQKYFKLLKPVSNIKNKIDDILQYYDKDMNNMYGIHIRHLAKTWINNNSHLLKDNEEKRINYMHNIIKQNSNAKFYLCTPDISVINKYNELFGDRIIYFSERFGNNSNDSFYIADEKLCNCNIYKNLNGVVDIFLLSYCNTILGDVASSYSICAKLMNQSSKISFINNKLY